MKNLLIALFCLLPVSLISQGVVINHSNTKLDKVSKQTIKKCSEKLKIAYQHTSHGSQLVSGLYALSQYNEAIYKFEISSYGFQSGVFFNDYGIPDAADLGHSGDISWAEATKTLLDNSGCDRNVVMWSWCGGCSDNTNEGIDKYLNAMNELEKNYPNVVFVYMTGHLDGSGESGTLNIINERIRKFCIDNKKVLFDFADIESYSPDANTNYLKLNADDGCNYSGGNWAEEWLAANPDSPLTQIAENCSECAHSNNLNCARKGIATWQMLEWIVDNRFTTSSVEQDTTKENSIVKVYPNPADKELKVDFRLKEKNTIKLDIYDINGNHVKNLLNDGIYGEGLHEKELSFDITSLPIGTYDIRMIVGDEFKTKSFVVVR